MRNLHPAVPEFAGWKLCFLHFFKGFSKVEFGKIHFNPLYLAGFNNAGVSKVLHNTITWYG